MTLLEIRKLTVDFESPVKSVRALDGISIQVKEGEVLGLVGESGSGKSTIANSIMRLLSSPPAQISGNILFDGTDLLSLPEKRMRQIRGKEISIIFQDPTATFNPSLRIGEQVREPLAIHGGASKQEGRTQIIRLFGDLGMPNPENSYDSYPYQLSGGMRQRAAIAMALIGGPKLVIADEPTSSLDVTIQAQIIELFKRLKDELRITMILITHDLGVAASICDRVAVAYAGELIELGGIQEIFRRQYHPYTSGLMKAIPRPENEILRPIPGDVPSLAGARHACSFSPRCSYATQICFDQEPPLRQVQPGHFSACHHAETFGQGDQKS